MLGDGTVVLIMVDLKMRPRSLRYMEDCSESTWDMGFSCEVGDMDGIAKWNRMDRH